MAKWMRYRSGLFRPCLAALALATVLAGAGFALRPGNNLHTVVPGAFYRSAQPSADQIAAYRDELGIRSIINLRGPRKGEAWYDAEVGEARKLGIAHFDFAMNARTELDPAEAKALIALMREAPRPVLIHCKAGSDRTGLAAALYMAAIAGADEEKAEDQLSVRFGHLPIPLLGTFAMDASFEAMESYLGFVGS